MSSAGYLAWMCRSDVATSKSADSGTARPKAGSWLICRDFVTRTACNDRRGRRRAQGARGRNQPTRGSVWPMKEPPADLVTAELVQTLQVYWRLEVSQLDYLA